MRRGGSLAGALVLASSALAACSSSSTDQLVWYINPDTGGQATLAEECSTDDYTITTQVLPQSASEQRVQLIRRLAANDPSIDLMSLDPPYTAEFSNAGYLAALPDELASALEEQSFDGAVAAATWEDELVVAPFWSNTQVLWYRKSFVEQTDLDMSQPVTWEQLIEAAAGGDGQIGVQANKYEGYSVWINALVAGAGGQLVDNPDAGADADVTIDSEAGQAAATVIENLSSSSAAPPDLSVSNEGTAQATFGGDAGSFLVNWTYILNGAGYSEEIVEDIGYARYPQTVEGEESAPPYGGIAIGVNDASEKTDQAFEAVECITSPESQAFYGLDSGNMPASAAAYDLIADDPENPYPDDLLQLWEESVDAAAPRTVSPYWSDISGSLLSTWHPPANVSDGTPAESQTFTEQILQGEGLL